MTIRSLVNKTLFIIIMLSLCNSNSFPQSPGNKKTTKRPVDYVIPLVGTNGEGNTYPGAVAPFGGIQLSPDTDKDLYDTASGYEYSDSTIMGFSLTHFSGTGIPDLGDFLFIPATGTPKFVPGEKNKPETGYRSPYSHKNEIAKAGYYSVRLDKYNTNAEMTVSDRAGIFRFTFPKSDSSFIITDLKHVLRSTIIWSNIRIENSSTITGYHLSNGWAKERHIYFAARYSKPFDSFSIIKEGEKSNL